MRYIIVQRYYKNNQIAGYTVQDITTGITQDIEANKLKQLIASNKIHIDNATLTSDGKLRLKADSTIIARNFEVDGRADNDYTFINDNNLEAFAKIILKTLESQHIGFKVSSFNKDANTFILKYSNMRTPMTSVKILFRYNMSSVAVIGMETIPIAAKINGNTYSIKNTPLSCVSPLFVDHWDMINKINGKVKVDKMAKLAINRQFTQRYADTIRLLIEENKEITDKIKVDLTNISNMLEQISKNASEEWLDYNKQKYWPKYMLKEEKQTSKLAQELYNKLIFKI